MTDPSVEAADVNAATLADLAERIKSEIRLVDSSMRESVRHAIAAGELLIQAKASVPHGEWMPWLKENAICDRTARYYMRAFRDYGQNGNAVADLPLRDLHRVHGYVPEEGEAVRFSARPKSQITDVTVCRPGDLWHMGPHRVICADACSAEAVARLLGKRKPRLMVTDPPYGVKNDLSWRCRAGLNADSRTVGHSNTSIPGDDRADWSEAYELVRSLEVAYVWHADRRRIEVELGLQRIGFELRQKISWVKPEPVISRSAYDLQDEPCLYCVRKGRTAGWTGTKGQSNVWEAASPKSVTGGSDEEKFDHPNQKPLDIICRPILNHTTHGGIVYDPFLGSGTTLAAAEQTGRVCLGIEKEEKYVDIAIQRWQSLTDQDATLDCDGRTFAEIAQKRLDKTENASSSTAVDRLAAAC
jgi:DNA modification methylase